jgi:magnesium-transporting ATPase (P-type)
LDPFSFENSINVIIEIVQEGSAEKSADALKAMLSSEAVVIRDGKEVKIAAETLVPGDVVKINQGDRVPADIRLLQVSNLATLEAALTGESVPIEKTSDPISVSEGGDPMHTPLGDRCNMCFSATLVASGTGTGLVVTTGDNTEIGTINALVNKVEKKKTNVLKQIDTIAKYLAVAISIAAVATWLVAYFIAKQSAIDALSTCLVCAVAMIPAGLEALVTMVRNPAALPALLPHPHVVLSHKSVFVPCCRVRRMRGLSRTWPKRTRSFGSCRPWKLSAASLPFARTRLVP